MRSETGRRNMPLRLVAGLLTGLVVAGTAGCAGGNADEEADSSANGKAATVEQVTGTDTPRITLSDKAAARLGVTTDPVRLQVSGPPASWPSPTGPSSTTRRGGRSPTSARRRTSTPGCR